MESQVDQIAMLRYRTRTAEWGIGGGHGGQKAIACPGTPVAVATVTVVDFVLIGKCWMPKEGEMPACME